MEKVLEKYGFRKEWNDYVKTTDIEGNEIFHVIKLFGKNSFQMYSYVEGEEDDGLKYSTGVLKGVTAKDLEYLIDLLIVKNNS